MRTFALAGLLCLVAAAPAQGQVRLGPVGVASGQPFDDQCGSDAVGGIVVRAGWWLDGIQVLCGSGAAARRLAVRGGRGGTENAFLLNAGERIVALTGSYEGVDGPYIYSLAIITNQRTSPLYGNNGQNRGRYPFRIDVPPGQRVLGFIGSTAEYLQSIGLVVGPELPVASAALGALAAPALPTTGAGWRTVRVPSYNKPGPYCPQRAGACTDSVGGLRWEIARDGSIPAEAAPMGGDVEGSVRRPIYTCRAYAVSEVTPDETYPGSLIGVISPGDRGCRLAARDYTGAGIVFIAVEYDVLLTIPGRPYRWVAATSADLPASAARPAGHEADFAVCRPRGPGAPSVVGSVLDTDTNGCLAVSGGAVRAFASYEVLASVR